MELLKRVCWKFRKRFAVTLSGLSRIFRTVIMTPDKYLEGEGRLLLQFRGIVSVLTDNFPWVPSQFVPANASDIFILLPSLNTFNCTVILHLSIFRTRVVYKKKD